MIEYAFNSDSLRATLKIAEHIKSFEPKVNFEIRKSFNITYINCKFENEIEKDSFEKALANSLNIAEGGFYVG